MRLRLPPFTRKQWLLGSLAVGLIVLALLAYRFRRTVLKVAGLAQGIGPSRFAQPAGSSLRHIDGVELPPLNDPELIRFNLWPAAFSLNRQEGEVFVWASHVADKAMGEALLSRGVTHLPAEATSLGLNLKKEQKFLIVYRNIFGQGENYTPFSMANIDTLKRQLNNDIDGKIGEGADMISLDFENDQTSDDYLAAVRAMALHVKERYAPRYLDFLGMWLTGFDLSFGDNYGSPYEAALGDVTTFDDQGVIYWPQDWIVSGRWVRSIAHYLERARRQNPQLPQVGYFWHWNQDKSSYLPPWVAEGAMIFQIVCGGKGLKNWEDGSLGYLFETDEGLINGAYRLSQANAYRRGNAQFGIVPEISDDGQTWRLNTARLSEETNDVLVRLTRNEVGWEVAAIDPALAKGATRDIFVRVPGTDFNQTLRLVGEQVHFSVL